MARVIFDGLTKEQAKVFAEWFEGQGEQDCEIWFDENGVPSPLVDVKQEFQYQGDDVIVHCKTS